MSAKLPKRVLVVRLGAIGDVCNALVFATALKRARPDVEIGWVVHELVRPLVDGHPAVDRVHLWKRKSGLSGLLSVVREVRAAKYELAVDLQRIQKSALLARLSGAARVLGYDRERTKELSWIWTGERIAAGDPGAHMVDQYRDVARHLGADGPAVHELPLDPQAVHAADVVIQRAGGAPIVINLSASKPANRWDPERFGELANRITSELSIAVCFTGAPDERPALERAMSSVAESSKVIDLVGKTSLPQLWSLLSKARLFIGCDTGPMHLASAVGTPVVALFGPANPRRTGPYGENHRIVSVLPECAPCNKKTCSMPRHACMEDITVELVFLAVRELLAGGNGSSLQEAMNA